jgi:histidine triad (HIT) family protein
MTIFEKIIKGEINAYKIYEDEITYAFLDANPHNKGHILVIPKKPYETFIDIPDETLQYLILIVKKIAKNTKNILNSDGYNIVMNNGVFANQTVPHAHFHIIPRTEGDVELYTKPINLNLKESDFELLQERLSL